MLNPIKTPRRRGLTAALTLLLGLTAAHGAAQTARLTVKADQPGIKISPSLYGLMTEEINHSYDGGLYAELIQNRIFKDNSNTPAHWTLTKAAGGDGTIALDNTQPVNAALTTCLRLDAQTAASRQRVGAANDGYWGIPVKPNTKYCASFYAKAAPGFTGPLTASIESEGGAAIYASASVPAITPNWKRYTLTLTTGKIAPSLANRFILSVNRPGTVWLNLVSLMPPAYKNRANGNRPDLMQKLADMNPAFLRLPGGNYLEGNTFAERYDWKSTIHSINKRPGHQGPWGYRSSDGMGLLEFFEWCEDLKIEPLLAVFAGYVMNGEHTSAGPLLEPFVQEALDEIEYATGDTNTNWGAERAKDGHPKPFKIRYVEIGNEDNFDRSGSYDGRYAQFYKAIKAKYPALQIIATMPVKSIRPDVVDDHYYRSARAMARDAAHYDRYDRSGPKIFVGEWASTEGNPTPTLAAALGDAAWMTGMERNSDLIVMSCYAPLLVNVNRGAAQWGTNLIGYNALQSFGSPSYYAQSLFNRNRGDAALPFEITQPAPSSVAQTAPAPQGGIGVGTWRTQSEYKDISVTQGGQTLYQSDFSGGAKGWTLGRGTWGAQDGALQQTSGQDNTRALAPPADWTDYTYRVKARKIGGAEGFLLFFHVKNAENYLDLNLGGWGNTRSAIQRTSGGEGSTISADSPVTVETGRWYDVRIEVQGTAVRCYLDDKLVLEASDTPPPPPSPLYAAASRDMKTGDVILKIVNVSAITVPLEIDIQGVKQIVGTAAGQVISGEPQDVNTIAEPEKVAPKPFTLANIGPKFTHEFPAHSVTVLRLKTR